MDSRLQRVVFHAAEGGDHAGMSRRHGDIARQSDQQNTDQREKLLFVDFPCDRRAADKAHCNEERGGDYESQCKQNHSFLSFSAFSRSRGSRQ